MREVRRASALMRISPDGQRRSGVFIASLAANGKRVNDDDEHLVVVMDCVHVLLSRATDWLRLGLPRMGRSVPKLHSTPSRTSFGRRRVCPIRPSGLGAGRRLRVDDSARRHALGLCGHMGAIVRVRAKVGPTMQSTSGVAKSALHKIPSPERERPSTDDQRRRGLERWENEGGSVEHARTATTGRSQ
jgi:hypothetical protein